MAAYIAYIILVFFEKLIIDTGKSTKRKVIFLTLTCLELIILTGLRGYRVGADTGAYLEHLEKLKGIKLSEVFNFKRIKPQFETGYEIFVRFCALFGCNKTVFLFIVSTLIYVPFFIFLKDVPYPELGILCYFAIGAFSYSLGIFRQMIAVSLCLLSVKYILNKKVLKFLIIWALAFLFHKTAALWIVTYFAFWAIKDKKKFVYISIIISIVLLPLGRVMVSFITKILPSYSHYIGSEKDVTGGTYLRYVLFLIILFIGWVCKYFDEIDTPLEQFAVFSFCIGIIVLSASYSFVLMGRVVIYYSISLSVIIPHFIQKCFEGKERFVVALLTFGVLFILTFLNFNGNTYVCPFKFFWE